MQAISETKQVRKRQSKKPVLQLIETQSIPTDEVLHAPLIDQSFNPIQQTQLNEEKIEPRGRPKKYCSQEEAERIAAEQRSRAQQKYRIQRQEFRASAYDLQLLFIRRLQKTIITNDQIQIQYKTERQDKTEKQETPKVDGQMDSQTDLDSIHYSTPNILE
ncbi:MAG: hypothetical protein EZS28_005821 [Streblomastix strix]|uniref:BZIP domain-containing protein n=1 Tax=Streblomastix strix TaxID=222440 RepID=A0A5J4WUK9_9EUKA|nr:MAG: hypothetical protein EZS28_005821 [Streblomastix strix]